MRPLPMFVLLSGCAPSYDLEIRLDADRVAVGEEVTATLRGVVDVRDNASATVSIAIQDVGASLDLPDVTFETVHATPTGAAEFLDGRYSADNESAPVLFTIREPGEEITAKWSILCGTPGEWEVFGSVRVEGPGGAPIPVERANLRPTSLTCE